VATVPNYARPPEPEDVGWVADNWGWFVGLGLALIATGVVALVCAAAVTRALITYLGVVLLIVGGLELLSAARSLRLRTFLLDLVAGVFYLVLGGIVLTHPDPASSVFTLFIGLVVMGNGLARIALAWTMRRVVNLLFLSLSGLLTVLLGGLILARWPADSHTVLGVLFGIELVLYGTSWVGLGLAAHDRRPRAA
jgi:uncharacterized membrane protein HdeD (DUF308 family)